MTGRNAATRPTGLWLLLGTLGLYLLVYLVAPGEAVPALEGSFGILRRILPVLVLVTGLLGVSHAFLSPEAVARAVGEAAGPRGYLVAAVGGVLSHGPVYAWYPLLRDLRAAGMREGLIAVFLYNRAVKLPLIPLFLMYFELRYGIVLLGLMAAASVLQGLIVDRLVESPTGDRG
ncbi:MAG: hypothetical protein ACOCZC_02495 [Halodesulfurarchaeum sp.]